MQLISTIKSRIKDPTSRELVFGSLFFFVTKIIGIGMTYLVTWWVTNNYGAFKWGLFALCFSILNILTIFCTVGMDAVLVKYTAEYKSKKILGQLKDCYLKIVKLILIILLPISCFLVFFPSTFCRLFLNSTGFDPWIQTIGFTLPAFVLFQLNNSGISGLKNMLTYGFFKNIAIYGLTIIFFLLLNIKIIPRYLPSFEESGILILCTFGIATWIALLANTIYYFKWINIFKVAKSFSKSTKELLHESFPMFLGALIIIIITTLDILMLGYFKTPSEVGIYDICVKISISTGIIHLAVSSIATPKFSEYFSTNKFQLLDRSVTQSSKLIFWASFPIWIIILIFPEQLLVLFGEEFVVGKNTLIILTIGQAINAFCGPVGSLLKMTNKQVLFQNILAVALLINIVLNAILIPVYGIFGAAIASTVAISSWKIIAVYYARKKLNILTLYIPGFSKSYNR